MKPLTDEELEKLDDIIAVQADTGNWDYSEYMFGLLNGMLLARAVLSETNPDYPDRPDSWIQDLATLDEFNNSGAVIGIEKGSIEIPKSTIIGDSGVV